MPEEQRPPSALASSDAPPGAGPDPKSDGPNDTARIVSGTLQNVVGIVIAALATFAANILVARRLGDTAFGVVTVVTQGAFVLSFATRAGMDMAVLRDVAIASGEGRQQQIRTPVARAVQIATVVSLLAAALIYLGAEGIARAMTLEGSDASRAIEMAALGLPFLALANVWLSATRGLKIMRYTLYIFWAGQPLLWLGLMLAGWVVAETAWMAALTYSASWAIAAVLAYLSWRKESRGWDVAPMAQGDLGKLFRYAGPRAPAALFSQLLFWTDLFVLTRYASGPEVGVYSAALRAGQILVLFLTSVSLMFSPFVADLHNRGKRDELDRLFKNLTRWTLAATIPLFLALAVAPGPALRVFGSEFSGGQAALLILLVGQLVNIATGGVGFVLIMVGRTGWDLAVYGGSLALNLGLAFWLCPKYGMEGAAWANAVTFVLSKWARLALVRRFVDIWPYDRSYMRLILPTLAGLAAAVVAHAAFPGEGILDLFATGLAALLVYGVLVVAVGLSDSERRGIKNLGSKLRGGRATA